MKKFILFTFCLFFSATQFVHAQTDSELLQQKLAKISTLNADFKQKVFNPEGQLIQQSSGTLTIQRPGMFHWLVLDPDEELIVSDGSTMWLYSPFIEQVTIMNVADATAGTPFALLSGSDGAKWSDFDVKKQGDNFIVRSKDQQASVNSFSFIFDKQGQISGFVVQEQQGQKSEFNLTLKPVTKAIDKSFFEFKVPAGTEIDDQR